MTFPTFSLNAETLIKAAPEAISEVVLLDQTPSTNSFLLNKTTYPPQTLVVAKTQTSGRGRQNKKWYSPIGNIYSSYLWHTKDLQGLSLAVALSLITGLESLHCQDLKLKWPNDLYYDSHKLGGILIETKKAGTFYKTIIGFGINLIPLASPPVDEYIALETILNKRLNINDCLVTLIKALHNGLQKLAAKGFNQAFGDSYKSYDYFWQQPVEIELNQQHYQGFAKGITSTGELIVEGEKRYIFNTVDRIRLRVS